MLLEIYKLIDKYLVKTFAKIYFVSLKRNIINSKMKIRKSMGKLTLLIYLSYQ